MNISKVATIVLAVGVTGVGVKLTANWLVKSQGFSIPTWYTDTVGKIDSALPLVGTFGWLAIAGAGMLLYEKFSK